MVYAPNCLYIKKMNLRKIISNIVGNFINENAEDGYIKLQRAQFGDVSDWWEFNVVNGQHGEGVYAFRYGDRPMIKYYTKNGENLHTFKIPKKHLFDASNKNFDYWQAKSLIYNNPEYKAFVFKHNGINIPSSKEILITDPSIIEF